jgi:hypothetical protein
VPDADQHADLCLKPKPYRNIEEKLWGKSEAKAVEKTKGLSQNEKAKIGAPLVTLFSLASFADSQHENAFLKMRIPNTEHLAPGIPQLIPNRSGASFSAVKG